MLMENNIQYMHLIIEDIGVSHRHNPTHNIRHVSV